MPSKAFFNASLQQLYLEEVSYQVLADGRHWITVSDDVAISLRSTDLAIRESIAALLGLAALCVCAAEALQDELPPDGPPPPPEGAVSVPLPG